MPPRIARLRRFRQLAPLACCAWLLPASAAVAAASDEENLGFFDLPPFVVEGVRERPEPVPLGNALGPAATLLAGAARQAAGLLWLDGGEGVYPPRMTARGSGLQSAPVSRGLLLRLDSLPLNAADGSFNLALIEPAFFNAITFQPGGADPSAAAQALGGALDLTWWRADAEPRQLSLAAGAGGFVRSIARGAESGAESRWSGLFGYTRSDGWRPNSGQERLAAAGRAEWMRSDGGVRSLSLYATRAVFAVPGPLTLAALEQDHTAISASSANDRPRRSTDFARAVYRTTWPSGLDTALGVQATDDEFWQLRANGVAATRGLDVLGRMATRWRYRDAVAFEAGANGAWGLRSQRRFANAAGERGAQFADLRLRAATTVGWLEASWTPNPLVTLHGGFSAVAIRRAATGTVSAEGSIASGALAPCLEIAVATTARRAVEVFVRAERCVEAPTFDDLLAVRGTAPELRLGWTPLRLQRADTLAAGFRGRFGGSSGAAERLQLEVTAFSAAWRGELLRLADATGETRGTVNAGRTRHRGLESAVRWRIGGAAGAWSPLELVVTHTWSEARFARDPVYGHNRLAGLPLHVGAMELTLANEAGVCGGFGVRWAWGRTYADHGNRLAYGGHTVAQAKLGWRARRWSIGVEVENVFDRRHVASTAGVIDLARSPATAALFLPGRPRTFTGTFAWRW